MALGFLATTARSEEITLSLPTDLAAPIADALDQLREATTGERRARFEEAAGALPSARLTAPRDSLHELLAVAIDESGDRVSRFASRLLRGDDAAAAELRAELSRLGALLDLLETVLVQAAG